MSPMLISLLKGVVTGDDAARTVTVNVHRGVDKLYHDTDYFSIFPEDAVEQFAT